MIIGLTPALSISVAPSAIFPPPADDPDVVPGAKSGDAMPIDDPVAEDAELQPLEDVPPPSKVEPAEGVADWVI